MQEFQPILPGLGGRLFGGGGAVPAAAEVEVRCPRCDSANTKFCYYNNYNLSQPRHYCKTCRRYWTKGGLLRNVPVGGGCRKAKRPAAAGADRQSAGTHRDAKKNLRPGCSADAVAIGAAASAPNCGGGSASAAHSSGGSTTAGNFTRHAMPLPPPAPMFADQAAALASIFAPPPHLPAFSFSASSGQPKAEEEDADPAHPLTVEQKQQPSSASTTADTVSPFSVRPPATEWPSPAVVHAAGMFDLAGVDASSYWNLASWTDPHGTIYLP